MASWVASSTGGSGKASNEVRLRPTRSAEARAQEPAVDGPRGGGGPRTPEIRPPLLQGKAIEVDCTFEIKLTLPQSKRCDGSRRVGLRMFRYRAARSARGFRLPRGLRPTASTPRRPLQRELELNQLVPEPPFGQLPHLGRSGLPLDEGVRRRARPSRRRIDPQSHRPSDPRRRGSRCRSSAGLR